jgi:predicted signal transduction protein with EAL and GGDEF domain
MGGDEFTVILGHLRKKAEVAKVAQDLLDALAAPFLIGADKVMIGASAGISLFPDNATDSVDLFKQADYALYAAKRNGKNQISFYTLELGCSLSERTTLESQLRGAMDRGEISVHYQPEFNLDSRRLVRFEALARWTHPTLGTIPPHKFIPVAEESGMIVCLGSYIMERACAEAVTWQTIAPYPIQVAVNVSSIQFARNTFVAEVSEILRCTGLKPKFLQIELTESVMLGGLDRSAEMMRQLRALGVEIAIDDFGTGYSSLSHLPRLPFSALKVDRSFVADLVTNPKTLAMVTSLIALGQNLGMRIIAEGIENERQLQLVEELGCNDVQGYLLGRPIPDPGAHLWMSFPNVDTCEKAFSSF